ncbi:MAG TPA: phosphodiesterase, partial [Bacteroidetes bacterium]|nr:phosphodiesterase [Bacteroidota bacterium]
MGIKRVLVIGLDCLEPGLVFERFAGRLPTFDRLRGMGRWGRLRSPVPAITVPAWMVMATGYD